MFFSRKFFPFFATFFFGAFNDNVFRNALVILITYQAGYSAEKASSLTFLAMALLMLPYFPFSATAGQLADKFSRSKLFRFTKILELSLMVPVFFLFRAGCVPGLLCLLFFMGLQSALFSPLKYSYIPQVLREDELLAGNAYVNAGTYIAIILGAVTGNWLITHENGATLTGGLIILVAIAGVCGSFLIPHLPGLNPQLKMNRSCTVATWQILRAVFHNRIVKHCIFGLSSFWMSAALYVSLLAGFCKELLHAVPVLVPVFYLLFSFGVALGSILSQIVGKQFRIMALVPVALVLMGVFTVDLYFGSTMAGLQYDPEAPLRSLKEMTHYVAFWRICFDLVMLAACGGFYSVPLNALLQHAAGPQEVARMVSGNNIINSALIAVGTGVVMTLTSFQILHTAGVILLLAAVNFVTAAYMLILRKESITGSFSDGQSSN